MGCCGDGHGSNEQSQAQGKQTSWIIWIMLLILVGVFLLSVFT